MVYLLNTTKMSEIPAGKKHIAGKIPFPVENGENEIKLSRQIFGGGIGFRVLDPDLHADLCNFVLYGWNMVKPKEAKEYVFPGAHPVSLLKSDLQTMVENEYIVSEKTNGIRYLLCFYESKKLSVLMPFIVNRNMEIWFIPLHFHKSLFQGTMFDGELIIDFKGFWKFLVFDTIVSEGKALKNQNYLERMKRCKELISDENYSVDAINDPFVIIGKPIFPVSEMKNLVEKTLPSISHLSDGLIFTPIDCGIIYGKHNKQFKWKRDQMHTIDFQILSLANISMDQVSRQDKDQDNSYFFVLLNDNDRKPNVVQKVNFKNISETILEKIKDRDIVECFFDKKLNEWIPLHIRSDKNVPNTVSTLEKTKLNLQENINIQDLIQFFSP